MNQFPGGILPIKSQTKKIFHWRNTKKPYPSRKGTSFDKKNNNTTIKGQKDYLLKGDVSAYISFLFY